MHWVLAENMFGEDSYQRLLDALHATNTSYDVVKLRAFINTIEPDLELDIPVFVYGTTSMIKVAAKKNWNVFDHRLTYEHSLEHIAPLMLNGKSRVLPLTDITRDMFFGDPREPLIFIRPNEDDKAIVGQVMSWMDFVYWRDGVLNLKPEEIPTIFPDTKFAIAEPIHILVEWRFFVVDGKVITGSRYKVNGHSQQRLVECTTTPAWLFVESVIAKWKPCRAFSVDICLLPNDELKVLEMGSIHASGFYAADMNKIVSAINGMENLS